MIDNSSINLLVSENELDIINTITGNNIIYIPVATMSFSQTKDMDGSFINTSKTIVDTRDVDIYGNLEKTISLVSPKNFGISVPESAYEFKTLSETVYTNPDITNWLVGRPDNVKIPQHYQEDIKDNIIYKKFTYYSKSDIGWPKLKDVITTPNNNSSLSTSINYVYDRYGNTISETISAPNANPPLLSKITSFEYSPDFNGRFLTKKTNTVNGVEYITTFDYYSKHGLLKSKTSNPGDNHLTTEFKYDSFGKIRLTNNPDGGQTLTQFAWNKSGEMNKNLDDFYSKISRKDALFVHMIYNQSAGGHIMNVKITYFDKFEREVATVVFDQKNRAISTLTEYGADGKVFSQSEAHFDQTTPYNLTTYKYDKLGRVINVNTPTTGIITIYNGRSQTVINEDIKVRKTKTVNAIGKTISVEDPAGSIIYKYYSSGNTKSINALGAITTMKYDDAGNQTELNDPNAGTIKYKYNAFGQLYLQTDASGNTTSMSYDNIGRLSFKSIINRGKDIPDDTYYSYQDNPKVNGFGQLANIIGPNGISYTYSYDPLSRLVEEKESINNNTYSHKYTYYTYLNKIKTLEYPSEFKIKYNYKKNGYLENITELDGHILWQPIDNNGRGQLTDYLLGNSLSTHKNFDDFGFPEEIITSDVQDLAYKFDPTTGNLMGRTDNSLGYEISETFGYDVSLLNNRLTTWQVQGQQTYEINYAANGNIFAKTDVTEPRGAYNYGGQVGPHAVSGIMDPITAYEIEASNRQIIDYTGFNKVKSISQEVNDKDKKIFTNLILNMVLIMNVNKLCFIKTMCCKRKNYSLGAITKLKLMRVELSVNYII